MPFPIPILNSSKPSNDRVIIINLRLTLYQITNLY